MKTYLKNISGIALIAIAICAYANPQVHTLSLQQTVENPSHVKPLLDDMGLTAFTTSFITTREGGDTTDNIFMASNYEKVLAHYE